MILLVPSVWHRPCYERESLAEVEGAVKWIVARFGVIVSKCHVT